MLFRPNDPCVCYAIKHQTPPPHQSVSCDIWTSPNMSLTHDINWKYFAYLFAVAKIVIFQYFLIYLCKKHVTVPYNNNRDDAFEIKNEYHEQPLIYIKWPMLSCYFKGQFSWISKLNLNKLIFSKQNRFLFNSFQYRSIKQTKRGNWIEYRHWVDKYPLNIRGFVILH